jgi:hypothetical protein
MNSKWLLDSYLLQTSYHDDMSEIIKSLGFEYIVEDYVPLLNKANNIHFSDDDCVVMYGSIGFIKNYSKGRLFIPGAYYQEKELESLSYMSKIDKFDLLANSNHVFTTFKDLVNRKEFFYDIFNTEKIFIRPNSGFKTFTGLPIHFEEFDSEINSLNQLTSVTDETLVLVSSCKRMGAEYRFFIVDRQIITGSQYKDKDGLHIRKEYSNEAFSIAQQMAKNKWQPDLAYACDVGIVNGEPKIIELNAFSSSGFYACDIKQLLSAVNEIAVKEYNGEISIGE